MQLLIKLNAVSGTWQSYCYYTGTGERDDGKMTASDYMRYKDVAYGGCNYRAVMFDQYRSSWTGGTSSEDYSYQDDNGYTTGTVYWFRYEPLRWRVLDPDEGLVLCETVVDSQAYNNYFIYANEEYWGDADKTYYANDYEKSSIRTWLNSDFYNTAFTEEDDAQIVVTELDNSAFDAGHSIYDSVPTTDKLFLLSFSEVMDTSHGFHSARTTEDLARQAKGSDYAKSQGLFVESNGCSYWRLRSPGSSGHAHYVFSDGTVWDSCISVDDTDYGIRPAMRLNLSFDET